jgi:hypothetical protein
MRHSAAVELGKLKKKSRTSSRLESASKYKSWFKNLCVTHASVMDAIIIVSVNKLLDVF